MKTAIFKSGTALAKSRIVKRGISFKSLTIILGIAVAVIMAFSLWLKTSGAQSSFPDIVFPDFVFPPVARHFVELAMNWFF